MSNPFSPGSERKTTNSEADNRTRLAEFFQRAKGDPDIWLGSAFLKLASEYVVDKETGLERKLLPGEPRNASPFRMTHSQQRLKQTADRYIKRGQTVNVIALKDRRRKVTTFVAARFFARCVSISGHNAICVCQRDETAKELQGTIRTFYEELGFYKSVIRDVTNSTMCLEFEGSQGFEVKGSKISCVTSSVDAIKGQRGKGFSLTLLTEAPFYDNMEAVVEAIGASVYRGPEAENWTESTGQGMGNMFAEDFLHNWYAQNECNWWEKGYPEKPKHYAEAIFFPFFTNPANMVPLAEDVTAHMLIGDFDDEEKHLYKSVLRAQEVEVPVLYPNLSRHEFEPMVKRLAIEYMAFRRARLARFYKNILLVTPFRPYASKAVFRREYPATVREGFSGGESTAAIPADVIQFHKEYANSKEPVWQGFIVDSANNNGFQMIHDPGAGNVRVWKWPSDAKFASFSIDPNEGNDAFVEDGGTKMQDRTWAVSFDWATGEQILEYVSANPSAITRHEMWAICKFLASNTSSQNQKNVFWNMARLPYVSEETPQGAATFMQFLLAEKWYDIEKMYREMDDREQQIQRRTKRLGWDPRGGRKPLAVMSMKDYLTAGMMVFQGRNFSDEEAEPIDLTRLRLVASKMLTEQFSWFIKKPGRNGAVEYAAEDKGGKSPRRYDDGISALYIDVAAEEKYRIEMAGDLNPASAISGSEDKKKALQSQIDLACSSESERLKREQELLDGKPETPGFSSPNMPRKRVPLC